MSVFPKPPVKPLLRGQGVPVRQALTGQLLATRAAVKNEGKPNERVVAEHAEASPINDEPGKDGDGYVALSYGLTIPGPKHSYMTVRVDVMCMLPTKTGTDAEINETYARCDRILDEQVGKQVEEAKAYLGLAKE